MACVKFVPSNDSFEGFITLRVPNFDEKYGFLEDLDLEVDAEGGVAISDSKKKLSMIRKAVKASQKFYVHVELKHKESGKLYLNYDEMSEDDKAHAVLIEVATAIMSGLPMGNG